MAYTNIDDPSAYFQAVLWTGDGLDNKQITNDGNSDLQPDWVWLKDRTQAESHAVFDSTRGATVRLQPNSNSLESTETATLKSFTTDGFTVGTSGSVNNGSNPDQYVGWQWKANGGTTSTNTDGDINSTVQVNQDAGFSIVTDSPTNTTARSIGHGLGVAPQVIIRRARTRVESWRVFHSAAGSTGGLTLNSTAAYNSSTTLFTGVTSTTFGVGTDFSVNGNYNYISYCFVEKQGYSKFGSYVGNGNANGTFVYTGFKPAFVIVKNATNSGYDWAMTDHKRSPVNEVDKYLWSNLSSAEYDGSGLSLDIDYLSNGFKLRTSRSETNLNTATYIYMAFAENPFVTSTGIPTTAR